MSEKIPLTADVVMNELPCWEFCNALISALVKLSDCARPQLSKP